MNDIKKEVKRRFKISKFLENIMADEAVENFNKNKSLIVKEKKQKKYREYIQYFTRLWLNYLSKEQFEKLAAKKLKQTVIPVRTEYEEEGL
jgi:hypothetical protein